VATARLNQGATAKYLQLDPYSALTTIGQPNVLVQTNFDSELYSAGMFVIVAEDCTDSTGSSYNGLLGEVWLEYTLDFSDPIWTISRTAQNDDSTWLGTTLCLSGAPIYTIPWFESVATSANYFNSNVGWPESETLLQPQAWGAISNFTVWLPQPGLWKIDVQAFFVPTTPLGQYYIWPNPSSVPGSAGPSGWNAVALGPGMSYQWMAAGATPPYTAANVSMYCTVAQPVYAGGPPATLTVGYLSWVIYVKSTIPNSRLDLGGTALSPGLGVGLSNALGSYGAIPQSVTVSSAVNVSPGTYNDA